ncbi:MAG: hypothetical protein D6762_06035 [Candidatus Neomarinimicrobiota bacterium]|nr:MAG: hypothetical protein D6762_06035 [Candidatus Neomarinimicrobiota bacterium]
MIRLNEFAFRDGHLVPIGAAAPGEYRCPCCRQSQHPRRKAFPPHFAHRHQNPNCVLPPAESALHYLAKQVLATAGWVRPPGSRSRLPLHRIRTEVSLSAFIVDLWATGPRGEDVAVEITVDHPPGPDKETFFREQGVKALEIDLRGSLPPAPALEEWILAGATRRWIGVPDGTSSGLASRRHRYRRERSSYGAFTRQVLIETLRELHRRTGGLERHVFTGKLGPPPPVFRRKLSPRLTFVQSEDLPPVYGCCAYLPGVTLRRRDRGKVVCFTLLPEPGPALLLPVEKKGVYLPQVARFWNPVSGDRT